MMRRQLRAILEKLNLKSLKRDASRMMPGWLVSLVPTSEVGDEVCVGYCGKRPVASPLWW